MAQEAPTPRPPVAARLSLWGLAAGFAAADVVIQVLVWPMMAAMHGQWGGGPMMWPGAHPMWGGGAWFGGWFLWGLIVSALFAGIAGVVCAAAYNSVASKG